MAAVMDRRRFLTGLGGLVAGPAIVRASSLMPVRGIVTSLESDGFANAPTGAPQYPTYFTNLNGISPYPVRPPWKVAGVDYRVGINTGVSLKDPATISSSVATVSGSLGAGQNANTLNIAADNVTLDGYDFTLNGGYLISAGGHLNLTILNSKLQNFAVFMNTSSGPLTMNYCDVNGLGASGETTFGTLVFMQDNVKGVFKYNWLHDCLNDIIDMTTNDITAWFNLFDTMGYGVGAHADGIQFAGGGTANNISIKFNTYVHRIATNSSPSSFIDLETQIDAGATMNNPEVAYNTASNTAVGGALGSTFYRVAQDVGAINNAYVHDNYADSTNMIGVISDTTAPGLGYRKGRNILLKTGGAF
jgi:hypothetical protein